jgi:hypothetical protein
MILDVGVNNLCEDMYTVSMVTNYRLITGSHWLSARTPGSLNRDFTLYSSPLCGVSLPLSFQTLRIPYVHYITMLSIAIIICQ